MLQPGQLVTCIDARPCPLCGAESGLQQARTYTVTAAFAITGTKGQALICVLAEARWPGDHGDCYEQSRFRPIEPAALDIFRRQPTEQELEAGKIEKIAEEIADELLALPPPSPAAPAPALQPSSPLRARLQRRRPIPRIAP